MNTRLSNSNQSVARLVGTSRCDVPARSEAEGGMRWAWHGAVPSPDAALGHGERRSAPSLPGWGAHRRSVAAFTMVEIALCLAIVGFALVAIIGVLPAGLNVQQQNREDTILNQDATVWLDAIRSGSRGYDELTNYVDRIVVSNFVYNINAGVTNLASQGVIVGQSVGPADIIITNGDRIVGLLTTPTIVELPGGYVSNYVYAFMHAVNSSAADAPPQDNADVRDLAFRYKMVVAVSPFASVDPEGIQTNAVDQILRNNLADVRLLFRWPLKQPFDPSKSDPQAGSSRMSFRTQIGGWVLLAPDSQFPTVPLYFLQPRQFQ
jgi:type II secretory pathway pseudopilin PulG